MPEISATLALPQVIMSLNPIIAGVTLAALWAADVSTACNLLLSSLHYFLKIFTNASSILILVRRNIC